MCADGLNGKKQVIRCSFGSFSWLHIKVVCLLGCLTILEIGMNLYCWFFFYFLSLLRLQIFETVTTSCIDGLSICKSISPSNFHRREWDWREKGPFGNSTVNSAKASWSGCIFDAPLHNSRGSALLEFMRKHTRTVCPGCKQSVAQLTEVATFTVHFICSKPVRIISDWSCLITNYDMTPYDGGQGQKGRRRSRCRLVWVDEVHSKWGNLS